MMALVGTIMMEMVGLTVHSKDVLIGFADKLQDLAVRSPDPRPEISPMQLLGIGQLA